jgi:hypothetical protein
MARHRRESASGWRRLLVPAAAVAALTTGGVVVAGSIDSTSDQSVAAATESPATTAATTTTEESTGTASTPEPKASAGPRRDADSRDDRNDEQAPPPGPPPTGEAPGFLGSIDLPDVPGLRGDWVGTPPVDARRNVSASLCDSTRFSTAGVFQEQARTYVVPGEKSLSPSFGLSETLGRFATPPAADRFLQQVRERVAACEERVSSASVSASQPVRSPELSAGTRWTMTFDVGERQVRYRMGVVRVGDKVAQVAFSPSDRYDITTRDFDRLLVRAGERLRELGSD